MKKEMNNKGFSLVELIIVIAIMVILVAVLAPQYLRYVEKSRVSTDTQTAVEFINLCQTIASDPDSINAGLTGTSYAITEDANGNITVPSDLQTVATSLGLMDSTSLNSAKFQSTAYRQINGTFKIELKYGKPTGAPATAADMWFVECAGIDNSGAIPTTP